MDAVEVVDEIYDLIAGDVSPDQIYLDLLAMDSPTLKDVTRLCRGTNVKPDDLRSRALFDTENGFKLAEWNDDNRIAYLKRKDAESLSALEQVHLLRYEADQEATTMDDPHRIEITGDLIDIATDLVNITGDEEYRRLLQD